MRNTFEPTLTFLSRSFAVLGPISLITMLAACGGSKWHEVAKNPQTGSQFTEQQKSNDSVPFKRGDTGHVTTDHLPARTSTDQTPEEAPAHLERNDKIEVVDSAPQGDDGSMQAVVVDTQQPDLKGKKVIVSKDYVSHDPVVPSAADNERDKYFMIQNIATEKVRVYRNCASKDAAGNCVHQMVLETDMTAGENTPDHSRRSILGSYRLQSWHKFYEDRSHFFPSFFAAGYPELPKPGASLADWMDRKRLPPKGGVMRGSFGWYTAYLEPNANNQWTHGTFGWGADGGKFIDAVKDPSNDLVMDVRSQGCTRVENQAIALMREFLPEGTRIVKVYAKEGYADASLKRYHLTRPAKWDWVLTQMNGANAPKSAKKWAPGPGHNDEILDHGTYTIDQKPDAVAFDPSSNGRNEENGNVYNVPEASMKGVFLIDEGRLAGYVAPSELKMGGETDHKLPSLMISTRTNARAVKPSAAAPARDSMN